MPIGQSRSSVAALEHFARLRMTLGGAVEEQLHSSIQALEKRDIKLANAVIEKDMMIDQLEQELREAAVELLGSVWLPKPHIPEILSTLSVSKTLERIGDLSKNVSKRTLVISGEDAGDMVTTVARLGKRALSQLSDVLDGYRERDVKLAASVWNSDSQLDEMFNSIFQEIAEYIVSDKSHITAGLHLAFVAKNYERVGDHTTNIAEQLQYSLTGEYPEAKRPKGDDTSSSILGRDDD
ncbi:MAG: phosphate signaling complex protein PhoU [Aquisalinus sp.]|nr:phosphate signaling complex protein PhoU [Aquisalinus sp.]